MNKARDVVNAVHQELYTQLKEFGLAEVQGGGYLLRAQSRDFYIGINDITHEKVIVKFSRAVMFTETLFNPGETLFSIRIDVNNDADLNERIRNLVDSVLISFPEFIWKKRKRVIKKVLYENRSK